MPTGFCKAIVARGGRAGRVGEFFRTPPARAFHSFKLYIHEAQAVAKFWNAFFFASSVVRNKVVSLCGWQWQLGRHS